MSLRTKILLIIFPVVAVYTAIDYIVERQVILPSFVELENKKAATNMARCVEAVQSEINHLETFIADWANWDDTYAFVGDHNQNYITSNLGTVTFKDANLNLLYICDTTGRVVWGKVYDDQLQSLSLKDFPADSLPPNHPLLSYCLGDEPNGCRSKAGLLMTEYGPMLFAAKPILTSQRAGPARGFIIMGTFFDKELLQKLVNQTKIDFNFVAVEKPESAADTIALRYIASARLPYLRHLDSNTMEGYITVADIRDVPVLLLRAQLPRDIYNRGLSAMGYTLFSGALTKFTFLVVLLLSLQLTVVGPISKLTAHTVRITESDNLASRLDMNRRDEIGILANKFDLMLEQLSKARTELIERSYKWGKAEMAAGVLHNLRNSLSPVVTRIGCMREDIQKAPLDHILTAQAQLVQENTPEERKADLQQFLELATSNLESLCRRMKTELEDLAGRTVQIERMLGTQDILSNVGGPVELTTIGQLVDDGMKMTKDALFKDISLQVAPSASKVGQFECDKISLSQVFANLLMNAAESIHRGGLAKGSVTVDANTEKIDSIDFVHIRIKDNGEGIAPADLERIFERGFTTKQEKEVSGIGLHWCANTVGVMHGRLWAQSDGIGRGACMHLLLPCHAPKYSGKKTPEVKP
jgi:two-component system NtrC family sensor kinase